MTAEARRRKGLYWDKAWYLVEGCREVDTSCAHCWAARFAARFGRQGELRSGEKWRGQALFRDDKERLPGEKKTGLTWAIWNDLFHPGVGMPVIARVFDNMELWPHHRFVVLTKRVHRLATFLKSRQSVGSHIWLGTSICSTSSAESFYRLKRLVEDVKIRCQLLVSVEPMLGAVNLLSFGEVFAEKIKLVICGCESGQGRRPCETDVLDELVRQCEWLGVPVFLKQWDFSGKRIVKPEGFPEKYQKYTVLPF